MDNAQQQIVDAITTTSNILVTVSTNPTVDELSAALGLTLILDKLDKRATAIYSGITPPAITFLEPEKTFEDSADSLRDFIIALNKEKADHLRYKVDGDVVKIFITPYKTKLTQSDLEFSDGDYNVDTVLALGVTDQDHLDNALAAHGKILHDAKVLTITAGENKSKLGSTDWHDDKASSLSEMVVSLVNALKSNDKVLDTQTSTALLTGIVSATDRFSNDRTSSQVMTLAAQLMAAGANQQLIAAKLQEAHDIPGAAPSIAKSTNSDGTSADGTELTIERDVKSAPTSEEKTIEPPADQANQAAPAVPEQTSEEAEQLELEKQLAGLTAPSTGTMADIEKELQDAAAKPDEASAPQPDAQPVPEPAPEQAPEQAPEPVPAPEVAPAVEAPSVPEPEEPTPVDTTPITAPSDATMPGFEPAIPAPSAASVPLEPPEVIENHGGPVGILPPDQLPTMSGTLAGDPEDQTVDPFNKPGLASQEVATINPEPNAGTPEGAAILSTPPEATPPLPPVESFVPPAPAPAPAESAPAQPPLPDIPDLPPLPPLPPLPADAAVPPLPPPPPPPPVFSGQTAGTMPAGAVSGDIFGDANTPVASEPVPTAPEPGQFKIPGQ